MPARPFASSAAERRSFSPFSVGRRLIVRAKLIPYTNFPLVGIEFYLSNDAILLLGKY